MWPVNEVDDTCEVQWDDWLNQCDDDWNDECDDVEDRWHNSDIEFLTPDRPTCAPD
jgi:hypothetical protein